jgi:hypothetical protein
VDQSGLPKHTHSPPQAQAQAKQDEAREALVNGLNEEIVAEYTAIVAYASLVALFRTTVADRQQRVQFLAEAVTALGGIPADAPEPTARSRDPGELLKQVQRAEAELSSAIQMSLYHGDRHGVSELAMRLAELGTRPCSHEGGESWLT